jgi:ribosome biogenesis GTPase / thiamine phosphate phosphatase
MSKLSKRRLKSLSKHFEEKERYHQQQRAKTPGPKPLNQPVIRSLAENIDQMVIVQSFGIPQPKPGLVDRLLVMAQLEGVSPILVLNKTDLAEPTEVVKLSRLYTSLSVLCIATSTVTGIGLNELKQHLIGRNSALCGHSGVGKSSLLRSIDPASTTEVSEVSEAIQKGRHTTTRVRLQRLSYGGIIYDLPGLKQAPINGLRPRELPGFFLDLVGFARRCRFADCLHHNEPECAVKEAVKEGLIENRRYASYLKILGELRGD